jgi:aromatic ring hydroxylase
MGLRTVEQFLSGLRDGREVYYRGQRVPDVTEHPELGGAARHAAIDFQLAENPKFQQLATRREGNAVYSTYYHIPRCTQDLLDRSKLIETGTALGGTLVLLIKEIGTDALFALMRLLARAGETQGLERVTTVYRRYRDGDLALAGTNRRERR